MHIFISKLSYVHNYHDIVKFILEAAVRMSKWMLRIKNGFALMWQFLRIYNGCKLGVLLTWGVATRCTSRAATSGSNFSNDKPRQLSVPCHM